MQYRQLGGTGLTVSAVCLGTWRPEQADERRQLALLDTAAGYGITFVDTADVYADGSAEQLLGRWLARVDRRRVVVATKVGGRTWDGPNGEGTGRKHIREACDASLRRLLTDYIDLYQVHGPDPGTPLEETVAALDDLVTAGKVLYWGLSNWDVAGVRAVQGLARQRHRSGPVCLQNPLNLLRAPAAPQYADLDGVGLLAYAPLARGLLSDRQLGPAPTPGSRVAQWPALRQRRERWQHTLRDLRDLAVSYNLTLSQLALAWLLAQPGVTAAVLGVSSAGQLTENLAAADVRLSVDQLSQVTSLAVRGAASGG